MAVIRIQSGKNLLDILEAPVTEREEALFQELMALESEQSDARKTIQAAHERSTDDLRGSGSIGGSMGNLASAGSSNNLASRNSLGSRNLLGSRNALFSSQNSLLRGSDGSGYDDVERMD